MYKIFELPKTEKEVGKLYSRSVKNSSFREEFLKRFKERMDVVHLELAQIFPEIKFDYSIKSLEECEKCVDAYLEQVSQLSQRIEQHTHWWTLPVEVKSIAFDMGLYTSLIVEKHSHNLDKWNWEY
jgi:hypothetical protein